MKTTDAPGRSVLANRSFRRLWLAQGISVFGDYLAMFAVQSLVVFRLHGSPAQVSAVLLISLLPAVAIGPMAGVFADRWNPRRTMIASDALRAFLVLVLVLLSTMMRHMPALSELALLQLCAICFSISCVSAFFVPAQGVMIPSVVERPQLLAASAVMQQTVQLMRIASPAIAAALTARFSENACFVADAASFVLSALMLMTIPATIQRPIQSPVQSPVAPHRHAKHSAARLVCDMRVGFRFLFANRELSFATLAMGAGTFAAGCYSSLAGVYVRDTLHATPLVYGALGSSTAIGMFAGSSLMAKLARAVQCGVQKGFLHGEKVIALGMGVVGLCIALLAAFPVTPVALLGSFGIGVGAASALVMANAVVRERTPAELRGRVVSVSVAMMSAAQAAAILVAGNGAAWIGVRGVFGLSAAMLLAQPACRYFRRGTVRSEPAACFQNLR